MWIDALLTLLYPERCAACDAPMEGRIGLCARCAESLYDIGVGCDVCAEPREAPGVCARCRAAPPPFVRVTAGWRFGGELATAVRRLKYGGPKGRGRPELARPLGAMLAPALARAARAVDVIVPVPLHPRRLRERGFSQAHALVAAAAGFVGRRALPPILPDALVRVRSTEEQAGLRREARERNVRGAFAVPSRASPPLLGRRVLLVDDVMTTGATASACAAALLRAGAFAVDVLALARADH